MSDVFEHNPGDHEDPLTGPTWIIGFIGAVLLVVIMLGLTALYYNAQREEELEKVIQREPEVLEQLHNAQLARITASPRYMETQIVVDGEEPRTERSLVIPIDRAMEIVVQESARRGQQ